MSIQAALDFRTLANASPELQGEVSRCFVNGQLDFAALSAVGRVYGLDFTAEEAAEAMAAGLDDELSDFEMDLVAGGHIFTNAK